MGGAKISQDKFGYTFSIAMIKKIIGTIWKKMPHVARQKIVRATQSKFTVSVAAVVTNERGEVLLLDHVLRPGSGWGFPGGFVNGGEQAQKALERELREETGLEIENVKLMQVRTINCHIEILFSATASGAARVNSREIKTLGWFAADNLPEDLNEGYKAFIRKVIKPVSGGAADKV